MKLKLLLDIIFVALCISTISLLAKGDQQYQQNAKRITRLYRARYQATPDKVFPLLCPVLEYKWLEHWRAEIVYTDSGVAELDNIFKTSSRSGETDIWTVTRYEKNACIEFVIANNNRITRFTITLHDNFDGTTDAEWKQVVTALNPDGEAVIEALTEEMYAGLYEDISMRLNYFLNHGTMYKTNQP